MYIYIIYIYIYISIHKVSSGFGATHAKTFVACLARNAAVCCIWPLEPGPEPQMARNGCSSPPRSRSWLEMASRARRGAADGSKWPLEPTPEPQNTRKVPLESAPEPQNARRVPLESAPEPQNARQMTLEPPRRRRMRTGAARACPGAAACSKSAARARSREVRSFLAFEMAARATWRRRMLDGCRSSLPRSRSML